MTDVEALLCCWLALKLERISIFVLASGMFASHKTQASSSRSCCWAVFPTAEAQETLSLPGMCTWHGRDA